MRTVVLATMLIAVAGAAGAAGTVKAPELAPGDTWTYAEENPSPQGQRTSHTLMTLVRADKDGILVTVQPAGSPGPSSERLMGPDWSRVRSVNGRQTVVNQPLQFPLAPGKTWRVAYTEFAPGDRRHTREGWDMTMRVTGWESVDVPAGTFRALKIEGVGTWTADTPASVVVARGRAPNGAEIASARRNAGTTVSGRYFKTFWYVPEVHRWVKSEEDYFSSNGVRSGHSTADLEAFTLANPHATAPSSDGRESEPARVPRARPSAPRHAPASQGDPLRETRRDGDAAGPIYWMSSMSLEPALVLSSSTLSVPSAGDTPLSRDTLASAKKREASAR